MPSRQCLSVKKYCLLDIRSLCLIREVFYLRHVEFLHVAWLTNFHQHWSMVTCTRCVCIAMLHWKRLLLYPVALADQHTMMFAWPREVVDWNMWWCIVGMQHSETVCCVKSVEERKKFVQLWWCVCVCGSEMNRMEDSKLNWKRLLSFNSSQHKTTIFGFYWLFASDLLQVEYYRDIFHLYDAGL